MSAHITSGDAEPVAKPSSTVSSRIQIGRFLLAGKLSLHDLSFIGMFLSHRASKDRHVALRSPCRRRKPAQPLLARLSNAALRQEAPPPLHGENGYTLELIER